MRDQYDHTMLFTCSTCGKTKHFCHCNIIDRNNIFSSDPPKLSFNLSDYSDKITPEYQPIPFPGLLNTKIDRSMVHDLYERLVSSDQLYYFIERFGMENVKIIFPDNDVSPSDKRGKTFNILYIKHGHIVLNLNDIIFKEPIYKTWGQIFIKDGLKNG